MVTLIGFPTTTVLYDRSKRLAGETKYPLRKMLALSVSAITSFSSVPLRLITMTALSGMVVLIGISLWVLSLRLFTSRAIPGWTSILLPVLLIGTLDLLAIGIVGEYLARIFDEVKARPRFLIAETRNLSERRLGCENPITLNARAVVGEHWSGASQTARTYARNDLSIADLPTNAEARNEAPAVEVK
jgi:hypothetical protein